MNKRRLNVGLLVSELEDAYTRMLCEGAVSAAKELDANLYIFPGRYFEAPYQDLYRTKYDYQHNSLFDFANTSKFDVILVSMGTIAGNVDIEYKRNFLNQFKGTPVITISSKIDDYPSVNFDNRTGFYAGLEHLIKEHGCKNIGFVSGTMNCDDANERLSYYKEALEKNGMKYEESKVVYGNFSEYSQEDVRRLMNINPDLDAVVFANDMMAIGGYQVFKELGLKIGKDIKVMGFDDSACAITLEPNLTTARADAMELGYQAVINFPEILAGRKQEITVGSILIHRESCGCKGKDFTELGINVEDFDSINGSGTCNVLKKIYRFMFDKNVNQAGAQPIKDKIAEYIFYIHDHIAKQEKLTEEELENLFHMMRTLCRMKVEPYTETSKIFYIMDYMYDLLKQVIDDEDGKRRLSEVYYMVYQDTAEFIRKMSDARQSDVGWLNYISTTFTRDILNFAIGDDRAYFSIVDKLIQLHFKSAYLCIFPDNIIHRKDENLNLPENVLLKSYLKKGQVYCLDGEKQKIRLKNMITDFYDNTEERATVIVTLLFSTLEQYGLLVSEIGEEYLHFTTPITYQISSAVKTIELLKNKEVITAQLEESLAQIKESNAILDEMSKSDELTQIYNRRGFLTTVQHQVSHAANASKKAVMIYADMNNLKIINDQFGHEEGDYSLKAIAAILKEAFGEEGIVGRFGGDEFAAFTLIDEQPNPAGRIRKKIQEITKKKNEGNGKPYYVSMSVGVCEFICNEKQQLQDLMDKADVDLYIEKRHKRNNILKQESEAV